MFDRNGNGPYMFGLALLVANYSLEIALYFSALFSSLFACLTLLHSNCFGTCCKDITVKARTDLLFQTEFKVTELSIEVWLAEVENSIIKKQRITLVCQLIKIQMIKIACFAFHQFQN